VRPCRQDAHLPASPVECRASKQANRVLAVHPRNTYGRGRCTTGLSQARREGKHVPHVAKSGCHKLCVVLHSTTGSPRDNLISVHSYAEDFRASKHLPCFSLLRAVARHFAQEICWRMSETTKYVIPNPNNNHGGVSSQFRPAGLRQTKTNWRNARSFTKVVVHCSQTCRSMVTLLFAHLMLELWSSMGPKITKRCCACTSTQPTDDGGDRGSLPGGYSAYDDDTRDCPAELKACEVRECQPTCGIASTTTRTRVVL